MLTINIIGVLEVSKRKILVKSFKIIILILAYTYIYYKFKEIEFKTIFEFDNYLFLLFSFLLMPLNWVLESIKWKFLISKFEKISFFTSIKAVLSGLTTSVFTPNRVGEFVGRIMFISPENRIKATVSTILGSYSQILITLLIGAISVFIIDKGIINFIDENNIIKWIFILVTVISFIIFFKLRIVLSLSRKFNFKKLNDIFKILDNYTFSDLLKVIFLSLFRYIVFFSQFYLLLNFFNVNISFINSFIVVGIFYLFLMFVPTFVLSEPGVRISTSIIVFTYYVNDISLIVYTVSLLWLINIVFPTILGTLFFVIQKITK